jgi:hypothetical protein
VSNMELNPSKCLRVTLKLGQLEVAQTSPRYLRILGDISLWWLDLKIDRAFLHFMCGTSVYAGFALSDKEAAAIRDTFAPLGLHIDSPEPSATSSTPKALQASAAAGDALTPVSVSPAGAGVLEVLP